MWGFLVCEQDNGIALAIDAFRRGLDVRSPIAVRGHREPEPIFQAGFARRPRARLARSSPLHFWHAPENVTCFEPYP